MTYVCPKDPTHQSTDPDYCSECGAKIGGQPSAVSQPAAPPPAAGAGGDVCPDCGTLRAGVAKFCEVCRYNFELGLSSVASAPTQPITAPPVDLTPPQAPDPAPVSIPDSTPIAPVIPDLMTVKLNAVVTVDPSLYTNPDPAMPCPTNEPEHIFPLDFPENLIGRRSDSRGSFPEVSLQDPGVSHRHAKLLVENDQVFLLELGSTNGTIFNGAEVSPGVKTPLNVGDSFTLGCWTRIEIKDR